MSEFKKAVPAEDYAAISDSVYKQFEMGYLDPELEGFLVRQLPPANLQEVSFLKTLGRIRRLLFSNVRFKDLFWLSAKSDYQHLGQMRAFNFQSFHLQDLFWFSVSFISGQSSDESIKPCI